MWQNALATAGWVLAALLLARLKRPQPLTRIGVSAKLPFAHAVVSGDVVYLSGVTAQADGDPIRESDSVEQQTRRVLRVIDERLSRAGTDKSRVVQAQVWLKDIGRDFAGMNAAWNEWVGDDDKPTRATVEAALAKPAMLVEIQTALPFDAGTQAELEGGPREEWHDGTVVLLELVELADRPAEMGQQATKCWSLAGTKLGTASLPSHAGHVAAGRRSAADNLFQVFNAQTAAPFLQRASARLGPYATRCLAMTYRQGEVVGLNNS